MCPLFFANQISLSLHSKCKGEGEMRWGGGGLEERRENGRGRLGRREGKGALAIKAHLTLCHPHTKIASKLYHLSLTCHVGTYNISRVNEVGSIQTFMEHF